MLFFIISSLITMISDYASFSPLVCSTGTGIGRSTCLPLLGVMTAFTSYILGVGSLEEVTSWTPLGFSCAYEGNLPFSYTC